MLATWTPAGGACGCDSENRRALVCGEVFPVVVMRRTRRVRGFAPPKRQLQFSREAEADADDCDAEAEAGGAMDSGSI